MVNPRKPETTGDPVESAIFNEDIKEYVKRRNMLKKTIKRLYSVVWGQSTTKSMRAHIIGLKTFKNFDDEKVSATLLKEIKAVSYK